MGDEITSPSVLINMLVELRQENRQLADELSHVQILLRALQDTAPPNSMEGRDAVPTEIVQHREIAQTAWTD